MEQYLNLNKSIDKKSIKILSNYYDQIFTLGEILFKGIINLYNKDVSLSKKAFSRLKTLSTLRFNFYSKQKKPIFYKFANLVITRVPPDSVIDNIFSNPSFPYVIDNELEAFIFL